MAIAQVEVLEEIDKIFENPTSKKLDTIDQSDFETYVNIDVAPFDKRITRFNAIESKVFLTWILENSDVAEHFRNVDNEYKLLEEILDELNSNIAIALTRTITGTDSLIEIAIKDGKETLEWIHNYFGQECNDDEDQEVCMFQEWYCKFNLTDEAWDDLIGSENFEPVIKEILTDYKCSSCSSVEDEKPGGTTIDWWDDEVKDGGDLPEVDDIEDLCLPTTLERE